MYLINIIISVLLFAVYSFLFIRQSKKFKAQEKEIIKKKKQLEEEARNQQEEERKKQFKKIFSDFQEQKKEYDKIIEEAQAKADAEKIRHKRLVEDLEEEFRKKKQYEIEQFNLILEQDRRYLDEQKERDRTIIEDNKKRIQEELEVYRKISEEKIINGFKELQLLEQRKFEDFIMDISKSKEIQIFNMNEEINIKKIELQEYQDKISAANEAFRLKQLTEQEWEAHHLMLSDHQLSIINRLLEIGENFPEVKESLRKIIWSDFLLKALNEMIKRQFGTESPSNIIYCIEDENGKYIGKTAQTARKRWEEHLKTSLEIGKTPQKIHRALYKNWNKFSFSVLDTCSAADLGERESYWINFYGTKDYGYNMKG